MKNLKVSLCVFAIFFACTLFSQPVVYWQKTYGNTTTWDQGVSIVELSSGGYYALMNGGGNCYGFGSSMWIYKLDESGNVLWQKCYGGPSHERPVTLEHGATLIETHEGGLLLSCNTDSYNGGNVFGNQGSLDYWVIKLTPEGDVVWTKCYGSTAADNGSPGAVKTPDGGYVLTGYTWGSNGNVAGSGTNRGNGDIWTIKIDGNGEIVWKRLSGGSNNEWARGITRATNTSGGYVIAAHTTSNNHDVSGNNGGRDFWVVRLSEAGGLSWRRCYGGSGTDTSYDIIAAEDGGYIVVGSTSSINGNVSGNNGGHDAWVIKIDQSGNLLWQKCIGGVDGDAAFSVVKSHSGDGYLILGRTTTNSGHNSGNWYSWSSSWIAKVDESGNLLWKEPVGQPGVPSSPGYMKVTSDGGYLVVDAVYGLIYEDGTFTRLTNAPMMRVTKFFELGNVLPVDILYFGAKVVPEGVKVFWNVPAESDHVRFEILRGVDPLDMRQIDMLESVFAPVSVNYEAIDTNPFSGVSYYQLRQVFRDGTQKLTDVVAVYNSRKDHFYQDADSVGLLGERSRLVDSTGRVGGWSNLHAITHLSSGAYLIQGEESGRTYKFIRP